MIRKGRFVLCIAVLFILQTAVVHRFTFRSLRPDLLCLAVAFLALEANFKGALGGAFVLGLLRDLGSCGRLGASALLFVPMSAGLFLIRDHLLRESALTDMALVFAFVALFGLVHGEALAALSPGPQAAVLARHAFGQALFTAALCPLLFLAFDRFGLVDKSLGGFDA